MKLRSMTGFARVRDTIGELDLVFSIKSVNHRGLDIHFHTGAEFDPFENPMRTAIKRRVGRGHLDVRVQMSRAGVSAGLSLDVARLDAWAAAYRAAADHLGVTEPPDLNAAFRFPGMVIESAPVELPEHFEAGLIDLLDRTLAELNGFREREGAALGEVLLERCASLQRNAEEIANLRAGVLDAFHTRLKNRLSDLLGGAGIEPQRLVQEAAILADRSDIGEEIERLRIHAAQVAELIRNGEEAGKKLDFLFQEMNRETNTILSKTSGPGEHGLRITELAIQAKADIEKMREQSLNLE